mgnify:CR=1 FL=1|jgi:hypothetical protein
MSTFATGKRSLSISDRSGQAFPYTQMVKEWNGSLVHISEYEPKSPQLNPRNRGADPQGLQNARPQTFTEQSGGRMFTVANLTLPGNLAFESNGMIPEEPAIQNSRRQLIPTIGSVTIVIS